VTKKTKHSTDIILGDKYRDSVTGFEGTATATTFFLHACERVSLEYIKDGKVEYEGFDAPRLIHIETEKVPKVKKTGGPGGREPGRAAVAARR
jgi:hypothetical protein